VNDIAAPTPPPAATADSAGPFHVERDFAGRQYVGYREKQEDYYAFADAMALERTSGEMLPAISW
jgi:hypothetical protein